MNRSRQTLSAALLTLLVAISMPLASGQSGATAATTDEDYYRVNLPEPVSTAEVLEAAQKHDLTIRSVQHNGPTNGELIVGDLPLDEALEIYRATDLANFGTEPQVTSFVVEDARNGITIGGLAPLSVSKQSSSSIDPTTDGGSGDEGDVSAASISKPWAPSTGTMRAYNSSTGAPRQIRHIMSWDSRQGLNSYNTSDAEFVYEHDMKLVDKDPYMTGAMGHQACAPQQWMYSDTRVVTSNIPGDAKVYADNARASDACGIHDVSFGIFTPWRLSVGTKYKVVLGSQAGSASRSVFELQGSKAVRSCGLDSEWCVSLGSHPKEDYDMFVNDSRGWTVPGCYTWYREDNNLPVRGSC